jgi:hypothetical protein
MTASENALVARDHRFQTQPQDSMTLADFWGLKRAPESQCAQSVGETVETSGKPTTRSDLSIARVSLRPTFDRYTNIQLERPGI